MRPGISKIKVSESDVIPGMIVFGTRFPTMVGNGAAALYTCHTGHTNHTNDTSHTCHTCPTWDMQYHVMIIIAQLSQHESNIAYQVPGTWYLGHMSHPYFMI